MVGVVALTAFASLFNGTAMAQKIGKSGVFHACFKAKGKNKGALRLVSTAKGCKRLHGWRPVSWSSNGGVAGPGHSGAQGGSGADGQQGSAGPEGKQSQQGVASTLEKSLVETVKTQTDEIDDLTKQVADLANQVLSLEGDLGGVSGGLTTMESNVSGLGGELGDLAGTVDETCTQLKTVTAQADKILNSLLGSSVAVLGNLLNVPSAPDPLGAFECK